jgi:tRNA pseudouridine55 synthase
VAHSDSLGAPRRPRIAWRDLDGVVLLDKPSGPSSSSALQQVRRLLRAAKGGHAGTLDPLATGMLPLCFGQATKSCGTLLGGAKAYAVQLQLGTATDTGDAEGEVIGASPVPSLERGVVAAAVAGLVGIQEQVPPMHSALKHHGRRLYELARAGESVVRPARRIEVRAAALQGLAADRVDFTVECSTGTYVRVLGEELARRLGTLGHLAALRRLWVEPFAGRPMVGIEALEAWSVQGSEAAPDWLLPVDAGLEALPALQLSAPQERALLQGRRIQAPAGVGDTSRVYAGDGSFIGVVATAGAGLLRVQRLYVDPAARLGHAGMPPGT